jgi:hypothetical protein
LIKISSSSNFSTDNLQVKVPPKDNHMA